MQQQKPRMLVNNDFMNSILDNGRDIGYAKFLTDNDVTLSENVKFNDRVDKINYETVKGDLLKLNRKNKMKLSPHTIDLIAKGATLDIYQIGGLNLSPEQLQAVNGVLPRELHQTDVLGEINRIMDTLPEDRTVYEQVGTPWDGNHLTPKQQSEKMQGTVSDFNSVQQQSQGNKRAFRQGINKKSLDISS